METKTKWLLGGLAATVVIGGTVLYFTMSKKTPPELPPAPPASPDVKDTTPPSTDTGAKVTSSPSAPVMDLTSNLQSVKDNLGGGTAITYDDKFKQLSYKYLDGKNRADFFDNNRMDIVGLTGKKIAAKGSWSNGGKTIKMDNGKTYTNNDIFQNLHNARLAYKWS